MVIVVDVIDEDQLEREFERIRNVFKGLYDDEKPLQLMWGIKKAMEEVNLNEFY